jgi:hypothetical protein
LRESEDADEEELLVPKKAKQSQDEDSDSEDDGSEEEENSSEEDENRPELEISEESDEESDEENEGRSSKKLKATELSLPEREKMVLQILNKFNK